MNGLKDRSLPIYKDNSIVIHWDTDAIVTGQVEYGPGTSYRKWVDVIVTQEESSNLSGKNIKILA